MISAEPGREGRLSRKKKKTSSLFPSKTVLGPTEVCISSIIACGGVHFYDTMPDILQYMPCISPLSRWSGRVLIDRNTVLWRTVGTREYKRINNYKREPPTPKRLYHNRQLTVPKRWRNQLATMWCGSKCGTDSSCGEVTAPHAYFRETCLGAGI